MPAAVPAEATPPVSIAELNIPEDDGLGNIIYVLFEFGCDAVFTYCFVFTCACVVLCWVVEKCVCGITECASRYFFRRPPLL